MALHLLKGNNEFIHFIFRSVYPINGQARVHPPSVSPLDEG